MTNAAIRTKAALAIYFVIGAVNIVLGLRYFSSNEFMSYHSQAVGAPWQEVDLGVQTLTLALMKVAGGGWFILGFFTVTLALSAFKTGSAVARWTLPMGTLIFYLASFSATWGVYQETGAPTPWGQSLAMIGLALFALVIDAPWSSRIRDTK
jgi:hypothetical protein